MVKIRTSLKLCGIAAQSIKSGASQAKLTEGVSIDDFSTWRAVRFADPDEIGVTFRSTLMFTEPGFGLASFVQRVGRVSRGEDNGQVIVSLSEAQRNRHAWTRTIKKVIEDHEELDVQTFTAKILSDVRCRLQPTRKEVETGLTTDSSTVPFYRRASWRGIFWAALFIVAIRRTKMTVQKEANARLQEIACLCFDLKSSKLWPPCGRVRPGHKPGAMPPAR